MLQGVSLQIKKEERKLYTEEEEDKFWSEGLFGNGIAKQLLDTIYFYNGKMFGLHGGEPVSYTHLTLPTSDLV